MNNSSDPSVTVKCVKCGLSVSVPAGGRRLCGCGTWLSAEQAAVDSGPWLVDAKEPAASGAGAWPRIEGDLSAIERLNDGY
jgi:hypothetical protein